MRRLLMLFVLSCLVAVPATFAAERKTKDTNELIESSLAANPLDSPQARRAAARAKARREAARTAAVPPQLQAIAACESGGNPRAVSASGAYRGKYQFSVSTWQAVGGQGDPAKAPEAEQDRRAAMLYARSGPGQWPVCGA